MHTRSLVIFKYFIMKLPSMFQKLQISRKDCSEFLETTPQQCHYFNGLDVFQIYNVRLPTIKTVKLAYEKKELREHAALV